MGISDNQGITQEERRGVLEGRKGRSEGEGVRAVSSGEQGLLVYWGLTPQQQPGSYQGGEMMMMKSVFWWRKLR